MAKIPEQPPPVLTVQTVVPIAFGDPDAPARHERSDAAENRRRILRVAEQLFQEQGVEAVNMQDIARAAGVGQGTLYRRFANKGELCLGLLDAQMHEFQNTVLEQLREMGARRRSKQAQLEWFLDALVHFNERHAPLLCAALREAPFGPNVEPGARSSPFAWMRMTVIGLLQSGIAAREFDASIDVPVVADALLGVLQPLSFQPMRNDYSLERISTGLVRLLRGLMKTDDRR
jgi:AcrR family transcriptional regulator